MRCENLNSSRELDCWIEGGKQSITRITNTRANLFSNPYLLNSQSHPLPSFLDLRHRVELTIFILEQFFSSFVQWKTHFIPWPSLPYSLPLESKHHRLHSCFQLGLIKRRHQQETGGWKKRGVGVFIPHWWVPFLSDSPPSTTPDPTRLWLP